MRTLTSARSDNLSVGLFLGNAILREGQTQHRDAEGVAFSAKEGHMSASIHHGAWSADRCVLSDMARRTVGLADPGVPSTFLFLSKHTRGTRTEEWPARSGPNPRSLVPITMP